MFTHVSIFGKDLESFFYDLVQESFCMVAFTKLFFVGAVESRELDYVIQNHFRENTFDEFGGGVGVVNEHPHWDLDVEIIHAGPKCCFYQIYKVIFGERTVVHTFFYFIFEREI